MKCGICNLRLAGSGRFCSVCGRAYDRNAHNDGTVMEALLWAAKRARFFERKRSRAAAPTKGTW